MNNHLEMQTIHLINFEERCAHSFQIAADATTQEITNRIVSTGLNPMLYRRVRCIHGLPGCEYCKPE